MDVDTLVAYNADAKTFAQDWIDQPAPEDMYALLTEYFTPGPTADIGCGAGRDTAWLHKIGHEVVGYDASAELLREAKRHFPDLSFKSAILPDLEGIESHTFQNVLCETVIMHLHPKEIGTATRRLINILRPHGTLFLSWRVTDGVSQRDKHRRLYSSFDDALVLDECKGHNVLLDRFDINQSSGKMVRRIIVRKN